MKHPTLLPDFKQVFQNVHSLKFYGNLSSTSRADTRGRMEGQMERKQTDGHYEDNRCLSSLCERAFEISMPSRAIFYNCCRLRWRRGGGHAKENIGPPVKNPLRKQT